MAVRPRLGRMVAGLVAEAAAVRVERAGCGPDVGGSALRRHYVARHLTRHGVFAAPCARVGVVAGAGGRRLLRVVAVRVAVAASVGVNVAGRVVDVRSYTGGPVSAARRLKKGK